MITPTPSVQFKSQWQDRYRRAGDAYERILARPLFDRLWENGAPPQIIQKVADALEIRFGGGPRELAEKFLDQAELLVEAVIRENVLDHERHRNNPISHGRYYFGLALLWTVRGKPVPMDVWLKASSGYLHIATELKSLDDIGYRLLFTAVECSIAAGEFDQAKAIISKRSKCRPRAEEFQALKMLCKALAGGGIPVRDDKTRQVVLSYFDKYRNPAFLVKPTAPETGKLPIEYIFLWSLIIGQCIDPGDGRFDAESAIQRASI